MNTWQCIKSMDLRSSSYEDSWKASIINAMRVIYFHGLAAHPILQDQSGVSASCLLDFH